MFPLGCPPQGDVARFDVIAESLRRTNLGLLQPGSDVNFERAAKVRRGRCEGAAVLGWQRGCGQQPVAAPERVCLPPGLWLALTTHTPQLLCAPAALCSVARWVMRSGGTTSPATCTLWQRLFRWSARRTTGG